MSGVPIGKILLRNVIRHTDAHNKIQEESEMWKQRQWEKQPTHFPSTESIRGSMHCDRVSESRSKTGRRESTSGRVDEREARYWSRKLYEFEANDPDRWGHSGFKELYPEEFKSDREESSETKRNGHRKIKKCKSSSIEKSKGSKKSSRKKKKKKKDEEEKRQRKLEETHSDSSDDNSKTSKCKQKRKRTKTKHKHKKSEKYKEKEDDSSSEDSDEQQRGRVRSSRKRKQDYNKGSDLELDSQRKQRKNWRANEENTHDSSTA